ncbi:SRPBCC family protein [Pendulispora albinea]|uniref:SRPBCC family protein n=1 Tax=Pendulispora albinea TaxID=2741071 RepID=A0ABZ2M428_9BACT
MSTTDRIEKRIVLRAPRSRVWRALTNAEEFSAWFEVSLEHQGTFRAGDAVQCRWSGHDPGCEGSTSPEGAQERGQLYTYMTIDRVEPERVFAYRWVPGDHQPGTDFSKEPTTRVEFHLDESPEGTLLRVVETGFDALAPERRARAHALNDNGWTHQMKNIARYLHERAKS